MLGCQLVDGYVNAMQRTNSAVNLLYDWQNDGELYKLIHAFDLFHTYAFIRRVLLIVQLLSQAYSCSVQMAEYK
jgi:hypothetical protein